MKKTYKAAYITEPKKIVIKEKEMPESLKPGYFMSKVRAASICGTDKGYFFNTSPIVTGHEFAVEVTDPGDTDLAVGDRLAMFPGVPCGECGPCREGKDNICTQLYVRDFSGIRSDGGYQEYYTGPAKYGVKIPDGVTDDEAAMTEPASVSYHAIIKAQQKLGDKVLIIGAGIIGLLCAEWAKRAGASYIAICEYNENRLKSVKEITDYDGYFDSSKESCNDDIKAAVPEGIDVVYECSASAGGYMTAVRVLKPCGKVVWVGQSGNPTPILSQLYVMKEVNIIGSMGYTFEEYKKVLGLIARKEINVAKYITDICKLDDIQAAFDKLFTETENPAIKIIVHPND